MITFKTLIIKLTAVVGLGGVIAILGLAHAADQNRPSAEPKVPSGCEMSKKGELICSDLPASPAPVRPHALPKSVPPAPRNPASPIPDHPPAPAAPGEPPPPKPDDSEPHRHDYET
jgi:hypothetical protein